MSFAIYEDVSGPTGFSRSAYSDAFSNAYPSGAGSSTARSKILATAVIVGAFIAPTQAVSRDGLETSTWNPIRIARGEGRDDSNHSGSSIDTAATIISLDSVDRASSVVGPRGRAVGNSRPIDVSVDTATVSLVSDASTESYDVSPQIFNRLQELAELAADDGFCLSMTSVVDLNSFIKRRRINLKPALTALDSGALRATWKNRDKEQVAIHFRGGDSANYVFFFKENGEMKRQFGQASIASIGSMLAENNLWRLLRHEG